MRNSDRLNFFGVSQRTLGMVLKHDIRLMMVMTIPTGNYYYATIFACMHRANIHIFVL